MKDIDFDELDRAVSSLMGGASKTKNVGTEAEKDTSKLEQIGTSSSTLASEPAQATKPTTPSVTPPRRSGRFMDMVPGNASKSRRTVPSRDAATISPPRPAIQPAERQTSPVVAHETISNADAWPDPMDFKPAPSSDTDLNNGNTSIVLKQPSPVSSSASAVEPFESPFLADAKVEKRPLNPSIKPSQEPETPDVDEVSSNLGPAVEENDAAVLPAEYSNELIAIESSNSKISEKPEPAKEPEEPEPTPVLAESKSTDHSSMRSGPTAIMQQYKEQPSSGDQSHASIYDTAHYTEPLAHPPKRKSGWMWVIWVVLLLIVGASGAVVLYNLGVI